jgi:hypothetical protein
MPSKPRQDGTDRRPRSDSALMSLPDDRQRELFDFCDGHRKDGLRKIRELLKDEQGVDVSLSTLSNWLNWYSLRAKIGNVSAMADDLARILKERPDLNLDDATIMRAAQAFFEAKAMQESDAETYVKLAGVRKGTAEIRIKERRIKIEEQKLRQAEAAKEVAKDTSLTPEQKEMRYREIFGLGAKK